MVENTEIKCQRNFESVAGEMGEVLNAPKTCKPMQILLEMKLAAAGHVKTMLKRHRSCCR